MDHFLRRPKLETAHEKPLAPRVDFWGEGGSKFSRSEFSRFGGTEFWGRLSFLDTHSGQM